MLRCDESTFVSAQPDRATNAYGSGSTNYRREE